MLQRLEHILRDSGLVCSGDRLLVAVSGGADSVALLHLLSRLAPGYPFELVVAHLDHRLRPESATDAEFVARLCGDLGVPLTVGEEDVAGNAVRLGIGLEDAGRRARRAFLEGAAREQGCRAILLGHHADDQAETVLFRLLRGSGVSGLAAMQPQCGPYLRPLLSFRREELREYLRRNRLSWCEDASNSDPAFSRNRIRHQLLPALAEYNPQIVDALIRLSRQAADEEIYWEGVSGAFLGRFGRQSEDGFEVPVEELVRLDRAERRRALRAFLARARGSLAGIEAEHIDRIDALLVANRPQADLDLPGMWVGRRYGRLLAAAERPGKIDFEIEIPGPGEYLLPTGERLGVVVGDDLDDDGVAALFAAGPLPFPLLVRSPRAGDRFRPSGMTGSKLLKDYFIDAKIDRESRQRTPVVCHGERIIWLAGRRRCEGSWPVAGEKLLKIALFRGGRAVE